MMQPQHPPSPTPAEAAAGLRLVEVVFPALSNHHGTLFAGHALQLLSKAAFLCASRHGRADVVMAACSDVQFLCPVRVGEVLELAAEVTRTGRSAMTVQVEAVAQSPGGASRRQALRGRFEMVAVDAYGRPLRTPLLEEAIP